MTAAPATARPKSRNPIRTVLVDLAVPIGMYYLLRALGFNTYLSLLLSAVVPGLSTVYQLVRQRRLDSFGLFVLSMIVLSTLTSLIAGSPRFLLAKDGWFTGLVGLWFFASLLGKRPLSFVCARPLLAGRIGPRDADWDALWERLPAYRRAWRVTTVIWGVAMLADAVVRVIMAYTLPIDVVPGLGGAQYAVLFVLLQVVTNVYNIRVGLYDGRSALYRDPRPVPEPAGDPAGDPA